MEPLVRKRDGSFVPFDRRRIANAVFKAVKAVGKDDRKIAEEVADEVALKLYRSFFKYGNVPHVEQIQDLIEDTLIAHGHGDIAKAYILYREKRKQAREIGKAIVDGINLIEDYLTQEDWRVQENSNMNYSLQGLNFHISSSVVARYWLTKLYPAEIGEGHREGDFHIHDLGILGPYTYFGKETIIARYKNKIILTSFESLYNLVEENEFVLNQKVCAFAKIPENLFVLDKDGWTKVTRLVRKKKDKPMRFIKNRGGRSVIVTEDHPMITKRGEKEALKVSQEDYLYTVDLVNLLAHENLFSLEKLDLLEEIKQRGWPFKEQVYFNGLPIFSKEAVPPIVFLQGKHQCAGYLSGINLSCGNMGIKTTFWNTPEDGLIHTLSFAAPRYLVLDENFGYFVGFVLAEGYLSYDDENSRFISVVQSEIEPLITLNEKLRKIGFFGCIAPKGRFFELRVRNPFLRFVFESIFGITPGARQKSLPLEILHYSRDFVKGLVAGLIDGDGSIDSNKTTITIRIASRSMLQSLATVLSLLGFTPRDRALEGQGQTRFYKGRKIQQRYPIYGLSFRKIEGLDLPSKKYQAAENSSKAWHDEDRSAWHKVLNNDPVEIPDEYIYDITTETHTLVVNGMWNHNCVGWDLYDLLLRGFGGVPGKVESTPAKHFRTALGQIVNFFYTLQGEAAGAQAFSNFDTLLAPFIRYDKLSYREVKQALQEFLFNVNVPTRVGFQTPFTNLTMDLKVPETFKDQAVVIGGKLQKETYGEFQPEMDMLNRAFCELMMEGDAKGRIFTFPIPTYNITADFDWENENLEPLWEMTRKYGIPYFANFVNSDMDPSDARSMCCRLRLDNRELRKRLGGLFGSAPLTGSIGVVTLNLPRIAYLATCEEDFFDRLVRLMELAKVSLEIKRKVIEDFTEKGLYPYSRVYLAGVKEQTGSYWTNHFATIGIIGMNEACLNFLGEPIYTEAGKEWAKKVLLFMREKIMEFQEETGNLYNLEATPAEGASYRLAKIDKAKFSRIIASGTKDVPYYTNSVHLPVNYTDDIFEILSHQDDLQILFTGGTVVHLFIGEEIPDTGIVKQLVRTIVNRFRLPYFSLTPTFSVCPVHGYIPGKHVVCPYPHSDEDLARFGREVELNELDLATLAENAYRKLN